MPGRAPRPAIPTESPPCTFWKSHRRHECVLDRPRLGDRAPDATHDTSGDVRLPKDALELQARGRQELAIDPSPGAVEVARRRGVRDVRLMRLEDGKASLARFGTVLMYGNNGDE